MKDAEPQRLKHQGCSEMQRFPDFNSAWFTEQMKRHNLTYADMARVLGVQVKSARSVAHKMLNGELKLQPAAAVILSKLFGVPLETVLKEAGQLDQATLVKTTERKAVQALLFADGSLLSDVADFPKEWRRTVIIPAGVPDDALIVHLETPDVFMRWTAFCTPWTEVRVTHLDRLMFVRVSPELIVLGHLRRGRSGTCYVRTLEGKRTEDFNPAEGCEVLMLSSV